MDEKLLKILRNYSEENLKGFKKIRRVKLTGKNWVNSKLYLRNSFKSPNQPAKFEYMGKTKTETPNSRKIFYQHPGTRFWIKDQKIAYLAKDTNIATYEIVPYFRDKENLLLKDVESYWKNENNCHSNHTAHPMDLFFGENLNLFDLYDPRPNPGCLIEFIKKQDQEYQNFYNDFLISRDKAKAYPKTQALAKWAFEYGFDGITYKSSRTPKDIGSRKCLVIFFKKEHDYEKIIYKKNPHHKIINDKDWDEARIEFFKN